MKRVLTLFVLSMFSFSLLGQTNDETAQLILTLAKRSGGLPSLYTKYYKVKAWSTKQSKPIPQENDIWTLSNFQAAMDVSTKKPIDWGVNGDRYVVVNIVPDHNNRPYHLRDDLVFITFNAKSASYYGLTLLDFFSPKEE